jgi:hypothetical protein
MPHLRCLYCDSNKAIEDHIICEECAEEKKEELGDDFDMDIFKRKTRPKDYNYFDLVDNLQEADKKLEMMRKAKEHAIKLE